MRVLIFCHSLESDWNHGNAHFLRGVCSELLSRGHQLEVFEPADAWSRENLLAHEGPEALDGFARTYPELRSTRYSLDTLDLDTVLDGADLVLVHEWSPHELVRRIGEHRRDGGRFRLLFHDTHHRSVSEPQAMADYDLRHYDGVLAFGDVVRRLYLERGWAENAWTWHEAADLRRFHPIPDAPPEGDLVWIGNWGDGERADELEAFLIEPVEQLGLLARIHGVRYPQHALQRLARAGIDYCGWLPNHAAAETFSRFRCTVHVPRRPYVEALPGIPTIRMFEALACGIPLVSAPWDDCEGLFRPGRDYLVARDGTAMREQLREIVANRDLRERLAASGLETIRSRHTCAHRVDELLAIVGSLGSPATRDDPSDPKRPTNPPSDFQEAA